MDTMNENTSIIHFNVTGHYGDSPEDPHYTTLYEATIPWANKINLMICAQEMTDQYGQSGGFEGCMDDLEVEAQRIAFYSRVLLALAAFMPEHTEGSTLFREDMTTETAYVVNFRVYAE